MENATLDQRDDVQGYILPLLIGGAVALGAWCAYRIGTTGPDVPAGNIPAPAHSVWGAVAAGGVQGAGGRPS